jgi:hypothetical protein
VGNPETTSTTIHFRPSILGIVLFVTFTIGGALMGSSAGGIEGAIGVGIVAFLIGALWGIANAY